jgi:ferredoxin-type protein NapG
MSSNTGRRRFIVQTAQGAAAASCVGLLWHVLLTQQARAAAPLRPPGAIAERDFAAACIKCGLCVDACPYDTLKLAKLGEAVLSGTPTFVPRDVPCFMCVDIPCAKVCPTGALDRGMKDVNAARMGLAVVDHENCLSHRGLRCEVCWRACPVRDRAISLQLQQRGVSKHAMFVPVVHSDACTGCGICEKRCPTEVPAIRIVDPNLVQGRMGAHYRVGVPDGAAAPAAPSAPWEAPRSPAADTAAAPSARPRDDRAVDYLNQGPR